MAARPEGVARAQLFAGLLLALLGLACVQNDGSRNPLSGVGTVSVDAEREVGFRADREIQAGLRASHKLIEDPLVLAFINELGQSMVATLGEQPFTYRFRVVAEPELNAFALPGGAIYFNAGTILKAGQLGELGGVMAHEIAHVKARHYARGVEQAAIPSILAQLAGIAATAATGQAEPLLIAQGVNVALQLSYSREFEAEADALAGAFLARAGYPADSMVPFFDRILAEKEDPTIEIPPYLYSHPAVESRRATALQRAENVTVTGTPPPGLERSFRAAQYRLALLLETRRTELKQAFGAPDRQADATLARLATIEASDPAAGIALLEEAEARIPADPRLPFQRGTLLERSGRLREAAQAFQRAAILDPGVALNFYRLGLVHKEMGDRVQATFFLEQAMRRFEGQGTLRRKTEEQLHRLSFPVVSRGGFGDGEDAPGADTPAGHSRTAFRAGDERVVWWAWIAPSYAGRRAEIEVRWFDPSGALVQETPADSLRRPTVGSTLELDATRSTRHGIWRVEAFFEDDVVDRRTFRLTP
ncbi:MAG: hypothetical protein CL910_06610 [Deltaproteobacteria bacterium]|nr:hypothetical protein [Deltaproteobacteria bacterium]